MIRLALGVAASLLLSIRLGADEPIVRIDETGLASLVSEMPKQLGPGQVLWLWSDSCAPRRTTSLPPADCGASDSVTLNVVSPARGSKAGIEIRWGPEEMLGELPDALLPRVVTDATGSATLRKSKGSTIFARVAGPTLASRWTEVQASSSTLAATAGIAASFVIRDPSDKPAIGSHLEIRTVDRASPHDLPFRAAGDGTVVMPPIPAGAFVRLLAWSDGAAPLSAVVASDHLPAVIVLNQALTFRGQLVDARKQPVSGADVSALFRVPGSIPIRKRMRSDAQGRFAFRGLAAREMEWVVRKVGFGTLQRSTRLKADLDAGQIVLSPARELVVAVVNRRQQPIAGASVRTVDGVEATSDARGLATLKEVSTDPFNASVTARGYVGRQFHVAEQVGAQRQVVVLREAARVVARLIRARDGAPAGPGTIAVDLDGRKTLEDFDASGHVDLPDLDEGVLSLEIRAEGLSPFRVPSRKLQAGEMVDLGLLALPAGLAIIGRVVDDRSTSPLAGASIHVLRPSTFGPLLSFAQHDWITTESSADGSFRADGLMPGMYAMWLEAPGHAPSIRTGVDVRDSGPETDLGDVHLPTGRTLDVTCEPTPRCGTTASVLIGGADWMPLSAPIERAAMEHGNATLVPVPFGPATLRLSGEHGVLYEREIVISETNPSTSVHVRLASVTLSGLLTRAGKPVAGGILAIRTSSDGSRLLEIRHLGDSGSLGSDLLGTVPLAFSAVVGGDGGFTFRDVGPGDYWATWSPSSGDGQTPPLRIAIPEAEEQRLLIDLPGAAIEGRVRMAKGEPLPATVFVTATQEGAPAKMLAGADGAFSIAGLAVGPVTVRVRSGDLTAETSLTLSEGETAHVELQLEPRADRSLVVTVRSNGAALPNAFVFLRVNGLVISGTSGGDGTVTFALPGSDGTLDAAVYSPRVGWAFVPPRTETEATELAIDVAPGTGTLEVASATGRSVLALRAPTGFPIDAALAVLGMPSASPLRLEHLPRGTYRVTANGVTRDVNLLDGVRHVDF